MIWSTTQLLDRLSLTTAEASMATREELISRQQQELLELSTPVVKLWDGILALPIIGTLDSSRTQVVMEELLQMVVATNSKFAIIDITGVPTVDTLVAQHLLKTITAARLMGAECIQGLTENPGRSSGEFRLGSRTVQLTIAAVTAENIEIGKLLVLSDITDRKLAECAVRTAEKIAATGKLANAIAHEINNPLEALTNLLYLAQSESNLAEMKGYLERANEELARISRITNQSLSFHRDTQQAIAIDLGSLMSDVVALYEKWAANRRVRLVLERHEAPSIQGFPGQLMQVFGNLVRNATEASPTDGEVIIRVRQAFRKGHEGTRVTIHDSGPGIPLSVQHQIFDPFFTTKELKGSGLGLWVSRTLILNHSGQIRFRSSNLSGRTGTTFQVFVPAVA